MSANWFIAGVLAVAVLTCRGAAQSPEELLEKGIYTQETVGDLDQAIEIYRQILSSSPAPRSYAAQAQYRLAQCLLQKDAKADAAREFKKVIEDYSEEKDLVVRARESLLPLAQYLDEDYYDPVLGVSFTSSEWPVSEAMRLDGGSVQVGLKAIYDPPRYPHRVTSPTVLIRRSKMPSLEAWFEEYRKSDPCTWPQLPNPHVCRVLSIGEVNGLRVLHWVSGQFVYPEFNDVPTVNYGVMMKGGKTELSIRVTVPVQELERSQAIIERIVESVRMP
ncbi:MAG TPA: tetratricopeptide repeat protein [Bryobacteraceae bacterium]|nr:tetratricopeptide repeat protein [Bryobacteraceae bacterium]